MTKQEKHFNDQVPESRVFRRGLKYRTTAWSPRKELSKLHRHNSRQSPIHRRGGGIPVRKIVPSDLFSPPLNKRRLSLFHPVDFWVIAAPHQLLFPVRLFSERKERFLPFPPSASGFENVGGAYGFVVLFLHARTVMWTCTTASARLMGGVCYEHPARPHASSEIRSDVAHSGTFTHIAYVSARGSGENHHSLQTRVDKQGCTKRTQTRTLDAFTPKPLQPSCSTA